MSLDACVGAWFMRLFSQFWSSQSEVVEVWSLKVRSDLHLARKAYHFFGVCIIIALYQVLTREQGLYAICVSTLVFLFIDFLRLRIPFVNRLAYATFGPFLRKEEMKKFSAMSYLLGGALLVIVFFPRPVGLLAFLFLAIGDPVSSIVGILYGKDKILGNKSMQGTLAGFIVCTFISILYFQATGIMMDRLILVGLLGGLIGAFCELVPIWKMDDNFTIPVLSATLLYVMFLLFGGFN